MYRYILLMVAVLALSSCGNKQNNDGASSATRGDAVGKPPKTPGHSAVREPDFVPTPEGVRMGVFFDDAGASDSIAVQIDKEFGVYVFALIDSPLQISAAQFSLDLPAAVDVLSAKKSTTKSLTLGDVRRNFMVTFECHDRGRFYLMRYTCAARAGFTGGKVVVRPGVDAQGKAFLGYVSCGPGVKPEMVPAAGTSAVITLAR